MKIVGNLVDKHYGQIWEPFLTLGHLLWAVMEDFNIARFSVEKIEGKTLSLQNLKRL